VLTDALDRVLGYLPRYFDSVGTILSRPVAEVSVRAANPALLKDALVFWLISEVLDNALFYIAHNADADQALYQIANLMASGVTLAVFAAAFFWGWRPLAPGLRFTPVATSIAYIWGALTPVTMVVFTVMAGLLRLLSPAAYGVFADALMGCAGPADVQAAVASDFAGASALYGGYLAVLLALNVLYLVYFIAFLRVLKHLAGVSGARYAAACAISVTIVAAGTVVGAFFHASLMHGIGPCAR
jgi:hypothetical protein